MTLQPVGGPPHELLAELRRWWQRPNGPLLVKTSGSTGRPRTVQLSQQSLQASAVASQRRLGGPAVWVLAVPTEFVAGLAVLVRSLLAGTEPVLLAEHDGDWGAAVTAARDAAAAAGVERCHSALVPTQLHRLAATGRLGELTDLDSVLLGGAAADPGLVGAATEAGVSVVRTYGMAETCGGCVYDGVPLDGVSVRVAGDGRVEVAGPVLFDGYADDPTATAHVTHGGWLHTEDLGRITADGSLQVLGRADDMVVSGGVNVSLPAVEQTLRRHRGVADVVVVGVPDDEWGARVVAVVRPATGGAVLTLDQLRAHVAAEHPRAWAPRGLVSVHQLPLLDNGKVDRVAALQLARRTVDRPS